MKSRLENLEKRIVSKALWKASPTKSISPNRFSQQDFPNEHLQHSGLKRPESFSYDNLHQPKGGINPVSERQFEEDQPLSDEDRLQSEPCLQQIQQVGLNQ